MKEVIIRTVSVDDVEKLLEIYAPYVEKTAITFEYEVPTVDEFRERIRHTLEKYPYLVAVMDSEIVGYAYAGTFHSRAAYDWAVETSIYVSMDHKREGIGRKLYEALEYALKKQGILNLNACIACPEKEDKYLSRDSIDFHRSLGYRLVGEFYQCGYKFGRWYNMVWMEKHIGKHLADQPPVGKFDKEGFSFGS